MGIYFEIRKQKAHKVEITMIMTDKRILGKTNIYIFATKQNLT